MKNKNLLHHSVFFTVLFFLLSQDIFAQNPGRIDLDGNWKFRRQGTTKWMDATVPGCVQTDLLKAGIISDPYFQDNEKNLQWIGETGWEYQKTFLLEDTLFAARHIELICEGLDTYANVYLNDSLIIVADNMFRTWFSDVKYLLRIGANSLRIQFPSVVELNKDRYGKLPYKLPGDERTVCRKAAYQFGWDFGPTFITMGIWRPIYLRTWMHMNVLGVQYVQNKLTDSVAKMTGVYYLLSSLSDSSVIDISTDGQELIRKKVAIAKGLNIIKVNFDIKNPTRWWTNELGEPHLYSLKHTISFADRFVGEGVTKIGLRTLELYLDQDQVGQTFKFVLNGIPVFMKGANYIPQDNFLTRVTDSAYRSIIKSAKDAHMNMLRVWGGGIYENDIFYNLCDENGILVWQDFMFANAMYPGGKDFFQNVQAEATQNVVRLRNHPCIALWCGNNEIDEGWQNWGWQKKYKITPEDSVQMLTHYGLIFQSMLPGIVERFDTLRPYIPSSPQYGWGHPESLKEGDSHYWGVWWGKEPFSNYKKKVGRFMSEFGFQGFPDIETIRRFTLPADRVPTSEAMKSHEKNPEGFAIIDEYLKRDYKTPKDFNSYDYVSQLLQAEGMKTAIEAYRRAMPTCMGSLFWQFNDCWPGITWSARDYFGKKKAFFYWLKDLYAPVLISPVQEEGMLKIYVVSDKINALPADIQLRLVDFAGNDLWKSTFPVDIPGNLSKVCLMTSLGSIIPDLDKKKSMLITELYVGKDTLARNIMYFTEPKNLALETPDIQRTITETENGYLITLSTDKLAKNVMLYSSFKGEYSDNFFDLVPGYPKKVTFTTKVKNSAFPGMLKIMTLFDACKQ
jgi:beta-mannosidase